MRRRRWFPFNFRIGTLLFSARETQYDSGLEAIVVLRLFIKIGAQIVGLDAPREPLGEAYIDASPEGHAKSAA